MRIKSGELKPGGRLPTERDLARDLGLAYDTVRRAVVRLRECGLIITVHGRGTYVSWSLIRRGGQPFLTGY